MSSNCLAVKNSVSPSPAPWSIVQKYYSLTSQPLASTHKLAEIFGILIKEIRDEGITIVLTTHYMEEAEILCDRLAIMDEGKIVTIDSPKNLIHQFLDRGFKKKQVVEQANLEDVFIDLTGKAIRD